MIHEDDLYYLYIPKYKNTVYPTATYTVTQNNNWVKDRKIKSSLSPGINLERQQKGYSLDLWQQLVRFTDLSFLGRCCKRSDSSGEGGETSGLGH